MRAGEKAHEACGMRKRRQMTNERMGCGAKEQMQGTGDRRQQRASRLRQFLRKVNKVSKVSTRKRGNANHGWHGWRCELRAFVFPLAPQGGEPRPQAEIPARRGEGWGEGCLWDGLSVTGYEECGRYGRPERACGMRHEACGKFQRACAPGFPLAPQGGEPRPQAEIPARRGEGWGEGCLWDGLSVTGYEKMRAEPRIARMARMAV